VVSEQGLERRRDEVVISGEPCAMPDLPVRRLQVELLARLNSQGNWHDERILLRALIDEVPDLLFAKDHNSRFIVANEATAIDLGLGTPDDLIGKSDADFYPPELAQKYLLKSSG
jgi:PAS domain-containing protein